MWNRKTPPPQTPLFRSHCLFPLKNETPRMRWLRATKQTPEQLPPFGGVVVFLSAIRSLCMNCFWQETEFAEDRLWAIAMSGPRCRELARLLESKTPDAPTATVWSVHTHATRIRRRPDRVAPGSSRRRMLSPNASRQPIWNAHRRCRDRTGRPASRQAGGLARVTTITSSPVTVLMS